MILNSGTSQSPVFFDNRIKFGVAPSQFCASLLKLGADSLIEGVTVYSLNISKVISILARDEKYSKSEEFTLIKSYLTTSYRRFYTINKDFRVRLWDGENLTAQLITGLKAITFTTGEAEIMSQALTQIVINESLASGLIASEDEVNFSSGDSEPDPVVTPGVVEESFHYAQAPLYYADIVVGPGNFAKPNGYDVCTFDSVSLVESSQSNVQLLGWAVTGLANYGQNLSWGAASGHLLSTKWNKISTPSMANVTTKVGTSFNILCDLKMSEARKVLVEFSGNAKAQFNGMKHVFHSGFYSSVFTGITMTNGFRYRWLADNLLEIEVDYGYQAVGSFDLPARLIDGRHEATSSAYGNTGVFAMRARVPGFTYSTDAAGNVTTNATMANIGICKSDLVAGNTYFKYPPTVGAVYNLTVMNDLYPFIPTGGPGRIVATANGYFGMAGFTIDPSSIPSAIAAKKTTAIDAIVSLSFLSAVTVVSVVAYKAKLAPQSTLVSVS